jgi:hypothetical protein
MKLFQYYSLDECSDTKLVTKTLNSLKKEGKIEYKIEEQDIFRIQDIDLDDTEIEDLCDLFDSNDVFPYLEKEEESEDDSFDDFYDGEIEY